MSPFEYFIRLDYLEYKESFVVPRIGFRGWCVIPDISYLDQVVVNPLLFSISEQRSDFHKGTVASNVIKLVEPLKIKFYPTKREVGLYDSKLSGLQLIFEGEFRADISQGRYAVILDSTLNKYRALSNQWEFDLAPESSRFQPRGGFLSPRVSWLKSSYFIIAGWAYREGDKIADVELLINNNKFDRVILGLNSKYLKETLLNVTNADGSVFTRLICANELADSSAWLNLRAKIRFQSNQQLELNYPAFRLEPATKNCAYLESAFVDLDGVARVRGYSMFGDVGLNTAQGFIHLPRVKGESNEHYPEASLSRSFDTELKLAKLPGKVQVYLRTAQGWKPAKPKFLQKCL